MAKARDAELRLTQQQASNGVVTTRAFDPNTGQITGIQAGFTGTEVENFAYAYDTLGSLTSRSASSMTGSTG